MNRDEFYAAMAPHDDARLRKILWTVYWRGNVQLRERIEDELRPQDQPKVKPKKELPDPVGVLGEVTTFVELARDGAYMAGDRRVHHTERSRWRHTFRRLAADALAALTASDPAPAQQAVGLPGALIALGAQLGGAVRHRRALGGAEAAGLGLGICRGHCRASFPDAQGLGVMPAVHRKARPNAMGFRAKRCGGASPVGYGG